jgi:hypothetical protein
MSDITAETAVYHIINSLDSGNVADWFDTENDCTWVISGTNDTLTITILNDDGNDDEQIFKLVPQ